MSYSCGAILRGVSKTTLFDTFATQIKSKAYNSNYPTDKNKVMTEEQRLALRTALKEVHDQIHIFYPRDKSLTECDKQLRNQLLVVDLVVHLAEEVIDTLTPNEREITERTANLLYAVKLIAPDYPFKQAAELLLSDNKASTD